MGILEIVDGEEDGSARGYTLPEGHAEVLLDRDSLSYLAPVARFTMGLVRPLPALVDAFRAGEGLPYAEYGTDAREGQADANRPMFVNLLGSEWLPSVPDVHERLQADTPARVADVGCGTGWSSISIARAYPNVRVDGYDARRALHRTRPKERRGGGGCRQGDLPRSGRLGPCARGALRSGDCLRVRPRHGTPRRGTQVDAPHGGRGRAP